MKVKSFKSIQSLLAILCMIFTLGSCVGTIKDKNAQSAISTNDQNSTVSHSFKGLLSATAVAHDKVELVFEPAPGEPASLIYELYINNSSVPLKISGSVLENNKTVNGNYLFTITKLSIKTKYNFNMRVVGTNGSGSAVILDPSRSLNATTFTNETADFMGVSSLALGSGNLATSTVVVNWIPATITGTNLNIKPNDPIAYEIIYWMNGYPKSTVQVPTSLSNPTLNRESFYSVNNLQPGATYYFQVRAIQKSYGINIATDPAFKRELNTRVMKITTKTTIPLNLAFITTGNLFLNNPIEARGRKELDVSWGPAWGNEGFFTYRVAYKKIDIGLQEHLTDQFGDINNPDQSIGHVDIDSTKTNATLTNLDPKAWYQVKVYVCTLISGPTGANSCTIGTEFKYTQVRPPLSPFGGIIAISNPTSITALDKITLNFNAPDIHTGFANKVMVYCHNPSNSDEKILIPMNGASSGTTTIASCNNTMVVNPAAIPVSIDQFNTFTSLGLKLKQNANGADKFCFSMTPAVSYTDIDPSLADDVLDSPVVKCITPNSLPPTVAQFPGRDDACNISSNTMTITWPAPTGGIYSSFVLFYKKKTGPNDVFSFPDAVTDYYGLTTKGYVTENLSSATFNKKITGLIEGESYFVGVLSAMPDPNDASKKIFSNYNSQTGECKFPTPSPVFNEWIDLMALGSKEDALSSGLTGAHDYLTEKFDDDGAPIEVSDTDEEISTPYFSGGIGKTRNISGTNRYFKSSSTGMIKLVWKDITFTNGSSMANFIINSGEQSVTDRSLRNYGYKVYRSEDNRQSWKDLTASGPIYPDDLSATPAAATSYTKTGGVQTPVYDRLVSFIDYTVEGLPSSATDTTVDRARVYWYKVVPFYLKKEQVYYTTNNNEHHIVRVTLPPKNMALVHRMIANRSVCLDLKKSINKKAGAYYSCSYNGLGASGLSYPWQKGNTVYDQGGDLLVDRFELGCAFTRGASDGSSYNASVTTTASLKNVDMTGFKGCLNTSQAAYEPYSNTAVAINSTGASRPHQVVAGDCFGSDNAITSFIDGNPVMCATAKKDYYGQYTYPGSKAVEVPCSDVSDVDEFLNFPHFPTADFYTTPTEDVHPTQSEFGAVYYNRNGYKENWNYARPLIYKGALTSAEVMAGKIAKIIGSSVNGEEAGVARKSSCQMNIGYKEGGKFIPRWVPVNQLLSGMKARVVENDGINTRGPATDLSFTNKKIADIRSNTDLYNSSMEAPPSRFDTNLPVARQFSSNSAKLPPLDGLSQKDLSEVCSTYKVEVGIKKDSGSFVSLSGAASKRLIRKKESTVASSWASKFSEATQVNYERYSCNGSYRNQTGVTANTNASLMTPLFPTRGKAGGLVLTGSSARDGSGHTEKCVSKFGIQDMTGNMWETNSEEIFCDFRPEKSAKLYIGDYRGGVAAAGIDKLKSVVFSGNSSLWYDSSHDGSGARTGSGVRVMVEENIDNRAGSCSIVDKRIDDATYLSGNNIIPIIKTDGTLNTSIVITTKSQDQDSVSTLRNGDGSFLTFGKDKVAMALDKNNKIADFTLFNPAVGLPILCGSSANCDINSDNQMAKTSIPLGNAGFSSSGISEISTYVLPGGAPATDLRYYYINQWLINQIVSTTGILPLPGDVSSPIDYPVTNIYHGSGAYTTPDEISQTGWSVSRDLTTGENGATMRMYTGGSSTTLSGKYSLSISGETHDQERYAPSLKGGRCAIMINNE